MKMRTAREWLSVADFEQIDPDLRLRFIAMVGADKTDEVQAAMKRISENLLDTLGEMKMREETLMRLMRAVSAIAVDNYLGIYRQAAEAERGLDLGDDDDAGAGKRASDA